MGSALHDDQALLSCSVWRLIRPVYLGKRCSINGRLSENLFHGYHLQRVAEMTDSELETLLDNPAIIRNRAKIFATRTNAQAFLQAQEEFGSFDAYLWSFVNGKTINNDVPDYRQAPAKTALSEKLAKDLKKRGFKFTGPVAVLSYLQAAGLVNDHENACEWKNGD